MAPSFVIVLPQSFNPAPSEWQVMCIDVVVGDGPGSKIDGRGSEGAVRKRPVQFFPFKLQIQCLFRLTVMTVELRVIKLKDAYSKLSVCQEKTQKLRTVSMACIPKKIRILEESLQNLPVLL